MNAQSIAPGAFRLIRRRDLSGHRVAIIHFPAHRSFAGQHPASWTVVKAPLPLSGRASNATKYSRSAAYRLFNKIIRELERSK